MTTRDRINVLETVLRILAGLVGLFFLALGLGFLALPEVFATGFFVEPARAVGINAIRGDFGALFLGMSFFCLLGTLTVHRRLLVVPIVFLALVVTGRLTILIIDDVPIVVADSIVVELIFLIILVLSVVTVSTKKKPAKSGLTAKEFFNSKVLAGFAVVFVIVGSLFVFQKRIGMALVQVIATQFSMMDVIGDLPDGLHVGLCGSGAPLPDAKRACPCAFVIAGKTLYVVDTGPGSTRKLELMKLQPGNIRAVLLTHFHSDHIGELGELMLKRWAGGSTKEPLEVFGPQGVETVVHGFNLAYSLDAEQRIAHHGPQTVPPTGAGGVAKPFDFTAGKEAVVIINADGLKVTAFLVDHRPVAPAVGYRFDYKGRSLVISGDTLPSDSLRRQARGVDLLLHEALQPTMVRTLSRVNKTSGRNNLSTITTDILNYHTFPEEAARIAADAGVHRLVLYHIIPPLPVAALNAAFLGDAKKYYKGPITIGADGMLFSMPAGKKDILKKWLL
jgi:ribonuclease Z